MNVHHPFYPPNSFKQNCSGQSTEGGAFEKPALAAAKRDPTSASFNAQESSAVAKEASSTKKVLKSTSSCYYFQEPAVNNTSVRGLWSMSQRSGRAFDDMRDDYSQAGDRTSIHLDAGGKLLADGTKSEKNVTGTRRKNAEESFNSPQLDYVKADLQISELVLSKLDSVAGIDSPVARSPSAEFSKPASSYKQKRDKNEDWHDPKPDPLARPDPALPKPEPQRTGAKKQHKKAAKKKDKPLHPPHLAAFPEASPRDSSSFAEATPKASDAAPRQQLPQTPK